MSSRPLVLHVFSAPRRVLCTRTSMHTHEFHIKSKHDSKRAPMSTFYCGRKSLPSFGSCYPSGGEPSWKVSSNPLMLLRKSNIDTACRSFASRRRPNRKTDKTNPNVLSNEELVASLIRKASVSSADKVTVRLVIDGGPDTPSSVEVLSLSKAIETSLDRELDLIGANLTGDPPVIRATQLSKLEYKHKQAQKKQQQAAANRKELKSFRFKAGIESNDLERKLDRLKGFLSKGHDCDFTVFTRMRTLRQNPNAGIELVSEIRLLLSDYGDIKREPQPNETKTFYRVQYEPKK